MLVALTLRRVVETTADALIVEQSFDPACRDQLIADLAGGAEAQEGEGDSSWMILSSGFARGSGLGSFLQPHGWELLGSEALLEADQATWHIGAGHRFTCRACREGVDACKVEGPRGAAFLHVLSTRLPFLAIEDLQAAAAQVSSEAERRAVARALELVDERTSP